MGLRFDATLSAIVSGPTFAWFPLESAHADSSLLLLAKIGFGLVFLCASIVALIGAYTADEELSPEAKYRNTPPT